MNRKNHEVNGFNTLMQLAFVVSTMLMFPLNSIAQPIYLTANDGAGTSSFNAAGNWSSHAAPAPGSTYTTAAYSMRTPGTAAGVTSIFLGDSLTLSNAVSAQFAGVSMALKGGNSSGAGGGTVIITNLIMLNGSGIGNANANGLANIDWVGGNINVQGNVLMSDINGAPRYIGIASVLSGSGSITNAASVIYGADNTAFTGPLIAVQTPGGTKGVIIVTNEAAMGGNPASFNAAQLYLNSGIFSPQGSFALDHANAGVTIGPSGGIFDIASGLILTNYEPIAGSGMLSFTNAGTFVDFGSASSFTGTLAINNGTFILGSGGSLAAANTIAPASGATFDVTATGLSLVNGQTLAGNGTVTGTVGTSSGSKLSPGGSGVAATLSISGDLNLSGGTTLACDFLATNDVVAVGGNFSASGVTTIQLGSVPAVGTYPLFTVAGTMGGAPANFSVSALSTRSRSYAVVYDTASTPKRILLQVTSSGSAASLVWQGDTSGGGNNVWDINTTANWLNGASSDVYFDADSVNFTDLGATNPPVLNVTVNPSAVNFNSSSNYSLSGAGSIAGTVALYKGGTGTFTLAVTNNAYKGGTVVTNGVLNISGFLDFTNYNYALGLPSGATPVVTVSNTGTFDLAGAALDAAYTNAVQIQGNGSSPAQGAIDNSVGGLTSGGGDIGVGTLVLNADSKVTVNQNWQIGNTGRGIVGNGNTLTVRSPNGFSLYNYLYLKSAAASSLGNLVIDGAGVLFWDHPDAAGLTATITLTNGGAIDTWNPATYYQGLTFYNPIVVSDSVNGGSIMSVRSPYNHPGADIYNGNVTLNGPLTFTNISRVAANQYNNNTESFGRITMNGNISGTGGIIAIGGLDYPVIVGSSIYGGNIVNLPGNNSYSGPTTVSNLVQLLVTTANQSGGSYSVVNYGTLDVAFASGRPTIPMSSLTLDVGSLGGGGNIGFTRLTGMPTAPVIYATNLTINSAMILPPKAGYAVGQFPLIKYNGTIGGSGFGGLQLGNLPAGVTATLVDNSANHTIDLSVTTTGIQWTGSQSTNWDLGTLNWYDPTASSDTYYSDGQSVVFGDSATRFNVNLQQMVQPGGITVNSSQDYTFSADLLAGISGGGALIKSGSGTLTISCTNNTFTGGTFINGGTLKLADTNFAYPYGGGALNNNLGTVSVANGGTLDINAIQVPNYQSYGPEGYNVFISGAGVGGNGALVNNNTNANDIADPGYVTLTGDATVGGPGDINIRMGVSPQLTSQSSAYTLTKVGAGSFRIRYVATVSTNFGPINILGGIVSYESSSTFGLGDPSKPITVAGGAGFAWGTESARCTKTLICSNNATLYGYNVMNNVFAGPVTLAGGNLNLNANYFHGMIFSNVISGSGSVSVLYNSYVTFAGANTYTGDTTVWRCNASPGSYLRLVGDGSVNNSANIVLQGITAGQAYAGGLNVSGRTDHTLTLGSSQTLRGDNGSYVAGDVVSTGATITPGGSANVQYMTFSNNLTMSSGSVVAMDVGLDTGITNDLINVVGTNNYAGTLQLANIGATALTNGASFKLFNAAHFTGNFASIAGSPGTGLAWTFNPTNGVATVISTGPATGPSIGMSLSGNQLTLSWSSDYLGYTLQAQTNTLNAGLSSNWVDIPDSSSTTSAVITIDPNMPSVFYRLRQ